MEKMIYAIVSVNSNPQKPETLLYGKKGIAGTGLEAVPFGQVSAIVSDTKSASLATDKNNAIEYAGVIESLAKEFTLLPVRFGSIMKSSEEIIEMLERNYTEIQLNLLKVENKHEFGLKVFCDSVKLKAELKSKSDAVNQAQQKPDPQAKNSIYKDWVNAKLKEHRFEEMVLAYVDTVIEEITEYLARLDAVAKFKKMITDTTIIDAVFLLDKEKKDALIHTVGNFQKQYQGLKFVLTGPWPPYNFVNFTIK